MKVSLVTNHTEFWVTLNDQEVAVDGVLIEANPEGRAAITLLVAGEFSLDLPDEAVVNLVNSPNEVADFIRTMNPEELQRTALARIGMEGDCETLAEAFVATIADFLEETDEAEPGPDESNNGRSDDGHGLSDPPRQGY